ncbi:acyltransferase [Planococcus sp. 1R117A]|uniref:acyltransferase n=1 Tax=Planococcus sp. 1R117A TaxID=3447020 RepID=UPI003EDC5A19
MKRFLFFDWLRVLATIAVVTIHISAIFITANYYDGKSSWLTANFFESFTRWCVPIFVMISGALILSDKREYTYQSFLKKRISKIFIPLLGWSILYFGFYFVQGRVELNPILFIQRFLNNGISVHFWFIYMLLGLTLVSPLIKLMLKNATQKDLTYFLVLWFYASVISRVLEHLVDITFNMELFFVTDYVGYYILGYYLFTYELPLALRRFLYVGLAFGLLFTFFLTFITTAEADGSFQSFWYGYHSPNVVLASIGLFVLFKHSHYINSKKLPSIPHFINTTSFGIYLVHMMVLKFIADYFPGLWLDTHSAIAIPYRVFITVLISALIVLAMKKVPVLKSLVP